MTPAEAMEIAKLVRDNLAHELRPLYKRLDEIASKVETLEHTDRKHSGEHKNLGADIGKTRLEMESTVERIDKNLVAYLKEVREGRTPAGTASAGAEAAAVVGAKAAIDAKEKTEALTTVTAATAVDTVAAKDAATKGRKWSGYAVIGLALTLLIQIANIVAEHWPK